MDWYLVLKSAHLIGVILFVGNIIVTGWWKATADRTRDPRILAFAQRQVTLTDWVFTLSGIVLVAAAGAGTAALGGLAVTTPWILWGSGLFVAAGVIWIGILVPLQTRLGRMARTFTAATAIPSDYWRLERLWSIFGVLATILPLVAVVVMVFKRG